MTEAAVQEKVESEESTDIDVEELGREQNKSQFVQLRAKGFSYPKIAKELKVSTSTLTNWNQELQDEIAQAKQWNWRPCRKSILCSKKAGSSSSGAN